MKQALQIFGFTIVVSVFYWYVSLWVPQKRTDPPEDIEIASNLTTEEMISIGEEIVAGKGTCLTCHTMGDHGTGLRFPDLDNIGAIAGERVPGQSDVEYLAESMYDPNAYVVEGFVAGMPNIARPPIALTDQEILTVIAYMQSLGGTPSVTMETTLQWQGQAPAQEAAPVAVGGNRDAETLFTAYLCNTCHSLDGTAGAGPTLQGLGERMSRAEIYEAIVDPDEVVTEGYLPGVMSTMLDANNFYEQVSTSELQALVDYLASM
ncbi:MAG: cytochrome c [Rhodothermaceae bacterium]|nr:cytochrome c [Bacteroidota bacterium]MXW15880.1 cytochrome c [Rhodothermaceae bacterium]MCY3630185.1 cytochrome c [Bacteroidota bacterium]MDE2646017.1 cytochrome c [Bacteroidota bacterium]MXW33707.1 cytochrome c [Rhodothermaceae bacterium]